MAAQRPHPSPSKNSFLRWHLKPPLAVHVQVISIVFSEATLAALSIIIQASIVWRPVVILHAADVIRQIPFEPSSLLAQVFLLYQFETDFILNIFILNIVLYRR